MFEYKIALRLVECDNPRRSSTFGYYSNSQVEPQIFLKNIENKAVIECFLTEYHLTKTKLRRNPIENRAISGFSGQKSVPK